MNKQELKKRLEDEKVRNDFYSLDGGLQDNTHCLDNYGGIWRVYYSERGKMWSEKIFLNEDDACNCLFERISHDLNLDVSSK